MESPLTQELKNYFAEKVIATLGAAGYDVLFDGVQRRESVICAGRDQGLLPAGPGHHTLPPGGWPTPAGGREA